MPTSQVPASNARRSRFSKRSPGRRTHLPGKSYRRAPHLDVSSMLSSRPLLALSELTKKRSAAMDLNYSPEELAFRDEVRSWLRGNLPDDLRQKMESYEELSKDD